MSWTDEDWCEEVNRLEERIEQYDSLTTSIRNILTEAGIPDREEYPDENVDEYEKSLRSGGKMIPLDERVKHLADLQKPVTVDQVEFLAKSLSQMSPDFLQSLFENLGYEIDEKYPNYEAGYTSTFLGKAAFEIGKLSVVE